MAKSELEQLENQRTELINDLIACSTIQDEIWKYHPDNPNKVSPVDEYNNLKIVEKQIQEDINKIEAQINASS